MNSDSFGGVSHYLTNNAKAALAIAQFTAAIRKSGKSIMILCPEQKLCGENSYSFSTDDEPIAGTISKSDTLDFEVVSELCNQHRGTTSIYFYNQIKYKKTLHGGFSVAVYEAGDEFLQLLKSGKFPVKRIYALTREDVQKLGNAGFKSEFIPFSFTGVLSQGALVVKNDPIVPQPLHPDTDLIEQTLKTAQERRGSFVLLDQTVGLAVVRKFVLCNADISSIDDCYFCTQSLSLEDIRRFVCAIKDDFVQTFAARDIVIENDLSAYEDSLNIYSEKYEAIQSRIDSVRASALEFVDVSSTQELLSTRRALYEEIEKFYILLQNEHIVHLDAAFRKKLLASITHILSLL